MIDFLILFDSTSFSVSNKEETLLQELANLCISTPAHKIRWSPTRQHQPTVYLWGNDDVDNFYDRVSLSPERLILLNGWAMGKDSLTPSSTVSTVHSYLSKNNGDGSVKGEYSLLNIDQHGNGALVRDALGTQQIYYSQSEDVVAIGTRASLVAAVTSKSRAIKISRTFARWTMNYSIPMSDDSLFEGAYLLSPGSSITFEKGRPKINHINGDFLFDAALRHQYKADRKLYWDLVYEEVISAMAVMDLASEGLTFPLSGGKDSRLLLGLVIASGRKGRIKSVFTNGPLCSPEVRAAQAVCSHFGLDHEHRDNSTVSSQGSANITKRLPLHCFITEGEMSPIDLHFRTSASKQFLLPGQEAGLRNIALDRVINTKDSMRSWLNSHLGGGDFCGFMSSLGAELNRVDIDNYIDRAEKEGTAFDQMPTRHRVEYRGARWVSRLWGIQNALGFSPHVFRLETVTKATYNAGARSRTLEEFHFEMLRRIDPKILEIPFANQGWPNELSNFTGIEVPNPSPYTWPENYSVYSQRIMFESIRANLVNYKKFVQTALIESNLSDLIDWRKFSRLDESNLRSGQISSLWQLFQMALCSTVSDFNSLRNDLAPIPSMDNLNLHS